MPTYQHTYRITGRTIQDYHDPSELLREMRTARTYIAIRHHDRIITLDLPKVFRVRSDIDWDMDIEVFVNHVTDMMIDGYTTTCIPQKDITTHRYIHRIDAFDALREPGMRVDYTAMYRSDLRSDDRYRYMLNDLVISSDRRDLSNCLVAVNGVFHKTFYMDEELFVCQGYCNIKNSDQQNIQIIDTGPVGGHSTVSLVDCLLTNTDDQDLRQGIYANLPSNHTFTDTTPFLVIDGHMIPMSGYTITGPKTMKIHTNRVDLIHNFLHNPNTPYTHDWVRDLEDSAVDPEVLILDDVGDYISHYLATEYPQARGTDTEFTRYLEDYYAEGHTTPRPFSIIGSYAELIDHYMLYTYPQLTLRDGSYLVQLDVQRPPLGQMALHEYDRVDVPVAEMQCRGTDIEVLEMSPTSGTYLPMVIEHYLMNMWGFDHVDLGMDEHAYGIHTFELIPKYTTVVPVNQKIDQFLTGWPYEDNIEEFITDRRVDIGDEFFNRMVMKHYFTDQWGQLQLTRDTNQSVITDYSESEITVPYYLHRTAMVEYVTDRAMMCEAAIQINRLTYWNNLVCPEFVLKALLGSRSFIVLVHNGTLYQKTYPLRPTVLPTQYEHRSVKDMPRGFLQYGNKVIPYVQYSAPDGQHTISMGYHHPTEDTYKDELDPMWVISPRFDVKRVRPLEDVQLVEYVSP